MSVIKPELIGVRLIMNVLIAKGMITREDLLQEYPKTIDQLEKITGTIYPSELHVKLKQALLSGLPDSK